MLETTVTGSVKLLGEVLALAAPGCFRDVPLVTSIVEHMCVKSGILETWHFRAAAVAGDVAHAHRGLAGVADRSSRSSRFISSRP